MSSMTYNKTDRFTDKRFRSHCVRVNLSFFHGPEGKRTHTEVMSLPDRLDSLSSFGSGPMGKTELSHAHRWLEASQQASLMCEDCRVNKVSALWGCLFLVCICETN